MGQFIAKSITNTMRDLHKSGVVDEVTMRNIENLCLPDVPDYTGEEIVDIRKKYKLSQAAMASVCNISPSTVQKWERGAKRPSGPSLKLLDLMNRKGLDVLV